MNDDVERLKLRYGFWKFLLGTVFLGILTAALNFTIKNHEAAQKAKDLEREALQKEREIESKELDQVGKYIDHALTENVGTRERFAHYFARVTRSSEMQKLWTVYWNEVKAEKEKKEQEEKTLEQKETELKAVVDQNNVQKKELEQVRDQLDSVRDALRVRLAQPIPTTCSSGSCITPDGRCGTVQLTIWCANSDGSPHACNTIFSGAEPGREYLSSVNLLTANPSKRAGVQWVCVPR